MDVSIVRAHPGHAKAQGQVWSSEESEGATRNRRAGCKPGLRLCFRLIADTWTDCDFATPEARFLLAPHAGDRQTTVKDRRKELGRGLRAEILADLGIDRQDF